MLVFIAHIYVFSCINFTKSAAEKRLHSTILLSEYIMVVMVVETVCVDVWCFDYAKQWLAW